MSGPPPRQPIETIALPCDDYVVVIQNDSTEGEMKKPREMTVDTDHRLRDAQTAWDSGRATFVLRYSKPTGFDTVEVNDLLDAVLGIGWQIAFFSTHFTTVMLNSEVAVMVFERP